MDQGHRDTRFGSDGLAAAPPPSRWDDWREYDAKAWPRKVERRYTIVPTVCFNCEAACGILAYVDQETSEVRKLEGHPLHPASRGRSCAKGPATVAQVNNPDRILYPLRRSGGRGEGRWQRVSWREALDDIASRIRKAIQEDRRDQVVYHVGRPGEDMYTERVLMAWGVDGHNSHTNVCSASARLGYALWMGMDRPTPDHENARFILLMSAHLESGHYFQPQAQRIVGAKKRGAGVAVIDTRLSNTASQADYWLAPWPGTEAGLLLAIANYLIHNDLYDGEFLERWVNWQQLMQDENYLRYVREMGFVERLPDDDSFPSFIALLKELYRDYTFQWAEAETGVVAAQIEAVAQEVARAGKAFASHVWRNAAAGNLGGW
ncbi:MAG: molybdopterin-dependent oxidoreductase, partial [Dehalococcoidia bacterium]